MDSYNQQIIIINNKHLIINDNTIYIWYITYMYNVQCTLYIFEIVSVLNVICDSKTIIKVFTLNKYHR